MLTCILTRGLPGSGKSTWALDMIRKHPGQYKRISKDDLRFMLDASKWSKSNERFVLQARDTLILAALAADYHVIADDTNLNNKHEHHIRELVKGQATVEIKDFTDVPLDVCIRRDLERPQSVGERVIRDMHRHYLQPKIVPPVYDPNLPDAIICDLDGTLALIHGRNPYDASKCEQDQVNEPVADIVQEYQYHQGGYHILFTSGRSEEYREETQRWLDTHGFFHPCSNLHLFMRATGDNRQDAIVKREIYEREILGHYNVKFVLDDREQVVRLWRSLGLTCLQVAEGDY